MHFHSLRARIVRQLLRIYSLKYKEKPLPLDRVLLFRQLAGKEKDALATPLNRTISTGKHLNNPYLAEVLANDELGTWALDVAVLNLLEIEIQKKHPEAILEFGCGISTICLARYMQELYQKDDALRVYSIEQDEQYAQKTISRLVDLALERVVRIIHAPLRRQVIEGVQVECYQLSGQIELLLSRQPDFVVIDGPAAEDGARFGTIPSIGPYLKGNVVFFLDDALRDGELQTGSLWLNLPYVRLRGIYLCGKGLLTGYVHNR